MGIKILLIEDNLTLNKRINDYLISTDLFDVIETAYDGKAGLEILTKTEIDVCVLDLTLPKKDGIHILEEVFLKKISTASFIVISSIYNDFVIERAINLGVEYYMLKPFDLKILTQRILDVHDYNNGDKNKTKLKHKYYKTDKIDRLASTESLKIDCFIEEYLAKLKIDINFKGYDYLKTCVKICIFDKAMLECITKILYPEVALMYGATSCGVERAIRHCIDRSPEKENHELYKQLFSTYSDFKITNRRFISLIANEYFRVN